MRDLSITEIEKLYKDNLATQKKRNLDNISKLNNRLKNCDDIFEKSRLRGLIDLHSGHKKVLNKIDYKKQASEHLSKIKK